jgi:hypothetical protein
VLAAISSHRVCPGGATDISQGQSPWISARRSSRPEGTPESLTTSTRCVPKPRVGSSLEPTRGNRSPKPIILPTLSARAPRASFPEPRNKTDRQPSTQTSRLELKIGFPAWALVIGPWSFRPSPLLMVGRVTPCAPSVMHAGHFARATVIGHWTFQRNRPSPIANLNSQIQNPSRLALEPFARATPWTLSCFLIWSFTLPFPLHPDPLRRSVGPPCL